MDDDQVANAGVREAKLGSLEHFCIFWFGQGNICMARWSNSSQESSQKMNQQKHHHRRSHLFVTAESSSMAVTPEQIPASVTPLSSW